MKLISQVSFLPVPLQGSARWEDGKLVIEYKPKVEGQGKAQKVTREIKDGQLVMVGMACVVLTITYINDDPVYIHGFHRRYYNTENMKAHCLVWGQSTSEATRSGDTSINFIAM